MTDSEQLVLETLHSGPESLTDLWRHLKITMTLQSLMDALWALQDGKQIVFMSVDGTYALEYA
jgi:hypothetical protein